MKKILAAGAVLAGLMIGPAFAATSSDANGAYEAIAKGKWSEAETMLRQALAQNPNDAARLLNLAFVLQNTGRQTEAAGVYQKVLQLDQNPLVAVDDPYTLSKPARAKGLARQGMASIENVAKR